MKIATYENCLSWSWSLTLPGLLKRIRASFTRIQRQIGVLLTEVDEDIILVQNVDSIKQIKEKHKCIVRIGGFLINENNLSSRYDKELRQVGGIIATNYKLQRVGESVNNSVMIPNGVDLDIFYPKKDRVFSNHKLTVGFAGNITGYGSIYKGWHLISQAVERMFLDIEFKACLFNYSQIEHDKMKEWYDSIDCLLLASIDEGCSNVISEALACGVPVILTQVGYHGEMLTDKHNCIFIKRTVDSIMNAIKLLSNDSQLRETLSKNGRKFVEQYQDINKIAIEYQKVFEEVINGN